MILRISDARKSFGSVRALDGAHLEILRGEKLALLGPNGAGKTTLVRALAGRVRLDHGTIEIEGRHLLPGQPRIDLGIVPQEIALYPELSALQNLDAFGRFAGLSGTLLKRRTDWALDWTGLRDRAQEPIKSFSGGMRRRVNIACATLHQPSTLILDEPTVGVDPQSRERIYDMLDELCRDGTSVLLTTHQLDEAEARCDRIVILDHGTTIATGTLEELVEQTIGSDRSVHIRVDREIQELPDGFEAGVGSRRLSIQVQDVARELGAAFSSIQRCGYGIEDVTVKAPSLQAVFLHLTGKDLRE